MENNRVLSLGDEIRNLTTALANEEARIEKLSQMMNTHRAAIHRLRGEKEELATKLNEVLAECPHEFFAREFIKVLKSNSETAHIKSEFVYEFLLKRNSSSFINYGEQQWNVELPRVASVEDVRTELEKVAPKTEAKKKSWFTAPAAQAAVAPEFFCVVPTIRLDDSGKIINIRPGMETAAYRKPVDLDNAQYANMQNLSGKFWGPYIELRDAANRNRVGEYRVNLYTSKHGRLIDALTQTAYVTYEKIKDRIAQDRAARAAEAKAKAAAVEKAKTPIVQNVDYYDVEDFEVRY